LAAFTKLLEFRAREGALATQQHELGSEAAGLMPIPDTQVTIALKELVRRKALSAAAEDSTIRRISVLQALGVIDECQLLPAPPRFPDLTNPVARAQEDEITSAILGGSGLTVVHASGGVGKSVLAQRLPALMPAGSEAVVFDGFANGAYRNPSQPRHRHDRGLLQIANELATRGLCNPLLPHHQADEAYYLSVFRRRLQEAALVVRARSPDAVVLIVLDAADNSELAAREDQGRSFARDLLQEAPPSGCCIVATARSERLDRLRLLLGVVQIELAPILLT
jgi:hypothetical protein